MITLHVLTEETSAQFVFEKIIPKLIKESDNVYFVVHPHQGKQDLEKALRDVVPVLSKSPGAKILITRDQDSSDCKEVKAYLREMINERCSCDYYIRIICKELEAWFLGDLEAIKKAFPRFKPEQFKNKADFRDVDKITAPNDYLLKIIPELSKNRTLPKLEVSEKISSHLDMNENTSSSFNQTLNAIKLLVHHDDERSHLVIR